MKNITCAHCNHVNEGVRPQDKHCENCGEAFAKTKKLPSSSDKEITVYMKDYFAIFSKDGSGCRATFSFEQLSTSYEQANIHVSCPQLEITNQNIHCDFKRKKRPHLHFKPDMPGLFTLDFKFECIKEDGSIDVFEAEADLPVNYPSENIHYEINNHNSQDTALNREGGVHQFVQVDAASLSHDPSNRTYTAQAIALDHIETIPANPIDTAAFDFTQGGKLPRYWISTKTTVIFGRADESKNGFPFLDNTDIPISFLSDTPEKDGSISRKHFEITRTDQGYVLGYIKAKRSPSIYINKGTPAQALIIKGGDGGKTNNSHEKVLLRTNDIITLCNMREDINKPELSYRVTRCQADAELCLVRENYSPHKECYILMPETLNLYPYIEQQVPNSNIELIYNGYGFSYRETNTEFEQTIVQQRPIKVQNIEFCLQ